MAGASVRLGKISAIDYPSGTVRVVFSDRDSSVTRLIPYFCGDEYKMPEIGDTVITLHLSNGSEAAVVLGKPYSGKNPPPEGKKGLYRKDFANVLGESLMRYFEGVLEFTAPKQVIITAEKAIIRGDAEITGNLTVGGKISASGDVSGAEKSLSEHTHTDSRGGKTSAAE